MKKFFLSFCLFLFCLVFLLPSQGFTKPFIPNSSVMDISEVRPGMKGKAVTVISGRTRVSFPVEVISMVPRKGSPGNLILVKAKGPVIEKTGGIASGMSGSPVYINDKLIGAIGYGWNFSEHDLGLVTPLKDMVDIWEWPENYPDFPSPVKVKYSASDDIETGSESMDIISDNVDILLTEDEIFSKSTPLFATGLSRRAMMNIGNILEEKIVAGGMSSSQLPVEYKASLKPGDAVGVLLAWGDVSMGATGTLTSISNEGRFIAFAHPFLNRGNVAYPLTRAWIHDVIPSIKSPFKLGTPLSIVGCVTQDRPQGIGGRIGLFLPSVEVSLNFADIETSDTVRKKKRFQMAYDPFLISTIFPEMVLGSIDDLWGRKGEGTFRVNLEVEGGTLPKGWSVTNYFFSDKDVASETVDNLKEITNLIALNPFREIKPLGFHMDIEVTSQPKVLYIEKVSVDKKIVKPGEEIKVEVLLRPYRKKQIKKEFTLKVPEKSFGPCEVIVRGGGISPLGQESIARGLDTISSFSQLLEEMSAREANNEVILEFVFNNSPQFSPVGNNSDESQELLSEVKKRRMEEGTLRIFKSNYFVEGLLRKTVTVDPGNIKEPKNIK